MKRFGVIGLGNISHRHRKNLKLLYPKSEIIALSARGSTITQLPENADRVLDELEKLIELRPRFVIIASPANLHIPHAVSLAQAGIPCLIEKPLSITYSEAKPLIQLSHVTNTPIAVGYCLRHMPAAKKMQELIANNILGEVYNITIEVGQYLPDWRPNIDYRDSVSAQKHLGGGALLELSHELDYAQWLFGELSIKHALLRKSSELNLDVEDLVDVVFSTENGAYMHIHLDFLQHTPQRYCTVKGANGRIHWNLLNSTIEVTLNNEEHYCYKFQDWQANDMYLDTIKDFEKLCANIENNAVGLAQAAKTLELIDIIKQSN